MEGHLTEALTLQVRKAGSRQVGARAVRSRSGHERQPGELGSGWTLPPVQVAGSAQHPAHLGPQQGPPESVTTTRGAQTFQHKRDRKASHNKRGLVPWGPPGSPVLQSLSALGARAVSRVFTAILA